MGPFRDSDDWPYMESRNRKYLSDVAGIRNGRYLIGELFFLAKRDLPLLVDSLMIYSPVIDPH